MSAAGVRMRRMMLGMSQTKLGDSLAVSFLRAQFRQAAIKVERLGIGQRLGVLHRPAVDRVAHCKLGDLAGFGARNIGDLHDFGRMGHLPAPGPSRVY
jgi:hypothetical protein